MHRYASRNSSSCTLESQFLEMIQIPNVRFSDFHMQSSVENVNKHIDLENIKGKYKWKIYH